MKPVALTIAGSDPSGGAGIQADLKTFHQFGVYGEAVIALLTVQNTLRVDRVETLPVALVLAQLAAVLEDIPPGAAKTGALGNAELVSAIAEAAASFTFPLVVDPVMISKHGSPLLSADARQAVRTRLLPCAALITPNLSEAADLTGLVVHDISSMKAAAVRLVEMGAAAALVKGGHSEGDPIDVLFTGREWFEFPAERVQTRHTHGTGCTYSAAITAGLASGQALYEAVARAKAYVTQAIKTNPSLGHGSGPVNHHAEWTVDMAAATLIPVEEYLRTCYEPDREYADGQLLERNVGEHDHSRMQTLLAAFFYYLEKQFPVRAFTEQRARVSVGPGRNRYRIPDVCVVLKPYRREPVLTEPPLLAIEILSPEDTVTSTMERLQDFRRFGIRHIWLIDPAARRTYRLEHSNESTALQEVANHRLPIPELGIEVGIDAMFLELDSD